jgi:hypothetical protein
MMQFMWGVDWILGVPMILASIAFHVFGLVVIEFTLRSIDAKRRRPRSVAYYLLLILFGANLALFMHVFEATAWAMLYWRIGSLPNFQMAMLFSLNALTSYGHDGSTLKDDWRLLGAIESMNGVMIFGLTTAYLFNAMSEFRPRGPER